MNLFCIFFFFFFAATDGDFLRESFIFGENFEIKFFFCNTLKKNKDKQVSYN